MMKAPSLIHRAALATLCLVLLSSSDLAAKGKPPGGGGDTTPPPNPEIAFVQSPRNKPNALLLANADGTNATVVYSGDRHIGIPDLSPTANELVFSEEDLASTSRVLLLRYSYSAAGIVAQAPLELDALQSTFSISADISPDGKYVLYRAYNYGVFLRSMDPAIDDARLIYDARDVRWSGVIWLAAATGYKIAMNTPDPGNPNEQEIIIATVDPTEPVGSQVIRSIDKVLATASQPFTILASIESARTSESIVAHALFKDEFYKTTPTPLPLSRPVVWSVETDEAMPLVAVGGYELDYRVPVPSPDDSMLIVNSSGTLLKYDLATQTSTAVGKGSVCDWKP